MLELLCCKDDRANQSTPCCFGLLYLVGLSKLEVQAFADHIKSGARSSQYLINRPNEFYSLDLFPSLALTNQMM